jgi:hypothetical protein
LSLRTSIPSKSNKIKFAVSGAALAAAAAGAVSFWPASAAAQPSASARQAAPAILSLARQAAAGVQQAETGLQHAAVSQAAQLDSASVTLAVRHLTPREVARRMLPGFGWTQWQFQWLNLLWERESGWNKFARNPYSGAYGIPQAMPGSKMASAGPNWPSNAWTQIRWGLRYIKGRYGSPHRAWLHSQATGWY